MKVKGKKPGSRQEWLYRLRKCTTLTTLDKIISRNSHELTPDELEFFNSAADHRLAELMTGRLYDRVPKEVWQHVR
ncbi:hemolysin expression modulator Hha [Escherichia coli]|uniref:hemolysin expression modulator Hha n=1 Tax=Escherichia coli TaxID=562 RepID=UPI0005A67CC3|nr:hemolysin expression modulator Hha [Escherichia coli]HAZ3798559.1 hemolysin expression modulator Hha [Escherichia coli]HBA8976433.1 hemolysin expression modulator Hha [Escherichia coli]